MGDLGRFIRDAFGDDEDAGDTVDRAERRRIPGRLEVERRYGYQPVTDDPPPTEPPPKPPRPRQRECPAQAARLRALPCGECDVCLELERNLNRDVVDPEQPGQSFWPATTEEHRVLLAQLEAQLASALRTIRALHRCPHCDRPLVSDTLADPTERPPHG